MAQTLIEALTEYQMTGDDIAIDIEQFCGAVALYDAGKMTASQIKTSFALSQTMADELDEILATRPSQADVLAAAKWAKVFRGIVAMGYRGGGQEFGSPFMTPADVRVALGLEV